MLALLALAARKQKEATIPPRSALLTLSVGGLHTCGLSRQLDHSAEGTNKSAAKTDPVRVAADASGPSVPVCWGLNEQSQFVGSFTTNYTSVVAGDAHTCALLENGTTRCFGANADGQAAPPAGATYASLAAGAFTTCGVRRGGGSGGALEGTVSCFGNNADGQAEPPEGVAYAQVAVGATHSCGVRADGGALDCWGGNAWGQATPPADHPASKRSTSYRQVAVGDQFTCGLRTSDGEIDCFGDGGGGKLAPPPGEHIAIAAGGATGCAIRAAGGGIRCWGSNRLGKAYPPENGLSYGALSVGPYHACATRATPPRHTDCWGGGEGVKVAAARYRDRIAEAGSAAASFEDVRQAMRSGTAHEEISLSFEVPAAAARAAARAARCGADLEEAMEEHAQCKTAATGDKIITLIHQVLRPGGAPPLPYAECAAACAGSRRVEGAGCCQWEAQSYVDPADEEGKTTRSKRLCLFYPGGTKKKLRDATSETPLSAAGDCAAFK